jgi:hypothetical protein
MRKSRAGNRTAPGAILRSPRLLSFHFGFGVCAVALPIQRAKLSL